MLKIDSTLGHKNLKILKINPASFKLKKYNSAKFAKAATT
jgi:hypothetical protein